MDMKSQKIGIEIEMTGISRYKAANVISKLLRGREGVWTNSGGVYDTYKIVDKFHRTWKIERDASISAEAGLDERKVELVSPVLYYDKIETLKKIVIALKAAGAIVNSSCGIHIHVDASNHDIRSLKNLIKVFGNREGLIKRILKINRSRESYCQAIKLTKIKELCKSQSLEDLAQVWYAKSGYSLEREKSNHYSSTRYHMLNLHNVWLRGTIEFRMFNSTLDIDEVVSYIQLVLAISTFAINEKRRYHIMPNGKHDITEAKKWFLNLGLTGQEFEVCRKTLLNTAF